jgi:hypothetical protein
MELFGIDIIDLEDFIELIARFFFNLAVVSITVRYLYYSAQQRKEYFFTYILISTVVFLLCFLLDNVKLELGFALGLFAIFGIIRYRTRQIPIKEMTYLFLVIGISVINALSNSKVSYAELIFTNLALLAATYTLENLLMLGHESRKVIRYERLELIKPEHNDELKKDLEERTGLKISRIEVGSIDLLTDTAKIDIYYQDTRNGRNKK